MKKDKTFPMTIPCCNKSSKIWFEYQKSKFEEHLHGVRSFLVWLFKSTLSTRNFKHPNFPCQAAACTQKNKGNICFFFLLNKQCFTGTGLLLSGSGSKLGIGYRARARVWKFRFPDSGSGPDSRAWASKFIFSGSGMIFRANVAQVATFGYPLATLSVQVAFFRS